MLEICETVHGFDSICFFDNLPPVIWLKFCEKMEKHVYLPGDIIFHEGSKATHFYVIKKGAVWNIVSSIDSDFYPFMEVKSYFGGYEAFNGMKNAWNVMAKTLTVIFSIHIDDFRKIFENTKFLELFMKQEEKRFEEM
jgi:CRP-like cAMP-binding protein